MILRMILRREEARHGRSGENIVIEATESSEPADL